MDKAFIYWDNSNIFIRRARAVAEEREGSGARHRVSTSGTCSSWAVPDAT